jgi:hypothetical protein
VFLYHVALCSLYVAVNVILIFCVIFKNDLKIEHYLHAQMK